MSAPQPHERLTRLVDHLVLTLALERDTEAVALGSTTYRNRGLRRGFEPDACYYFRDLGRFRDDGEVDIATEPPDVVVEAEVTRSSVPKVPLLAEFGVPEVWRLRRATASILRLRGETYEEASASAFVAGLTPQALAELLTEGRREPLGAWTARLRAWARSTG